MKRQVVGDVKWVKTIRSPFGKGAKSGTAIIKFGRRYEKKFGEMLEARYGDSVDIGPWFEFEDDMGTAICQPDVLYHDGDLLVIFEAKTSFTYRKAYAELRTLYRPVVEKYYNRPDSKMVQVCHFLKPSAKRVTIVRSLEEIERTDKEIMTWPWKP